MAVLKTVASLHGPKPAGPVEECAGIYGLKTSRAAQHQARIEGRGGHADVGIGRSHAALGGGDVGSAFEQLTRDGDGDAGTGIEGFPRSGEGVLRNADLKAWGSLAAKDGKCVKGIGALQLHRDATVIIDRDAASKLKMLDYYEWVQAKMPNAP